MRTTLVAAVVLCLINAATLAGATDAPVRQASVELNVARSPGVMHVTAVSGSETPLTGPVIRFITLPEGATARNAALADVLETYAIEGPRFATEGEAAQALLSLADQGGHLQADDLKRRL